MNLEIQGRDLKITDKITDHAQKKLARLDRYFPDIAQIRLELSHEHSRKTGEHPVAQITIRSTHGTILRTEEKGQSDLLVAIDIAIDKMVRQIERFKGKQKRRAVPLGIQDGVDGFLPDDIDSAFPFDADEETGIVVRRKQVTVAPMSEEEAIDQMELLGHTFFVFLNADTVSVNVVYKRTNGDYGLIQPLFG